MPKVITLLLLVFWVFLAYRQMQRGDLPMAGLFLAIGVALTVYRWRRASASAPPKTNI